MSRIRQRRHKDPSCVRAPYVGLVIVIHHVCEFVFKTSPVRPTDTTNLYRLIEVAVWPKLPNNNEKQIRFLTSLLNTKNEKGIRFSFAN